MDARAALIFSLFRGELRAGMDTLRQHFRGFVAFRRRLAS